MPSEIDPLLPNTGSSPEITGYGFNSKRSPEGTYQTVPPDDEDERDARPSESGGTTRSALSTIIGIFTVVVLFAFVFASLSSDGLRDDQPAPEPVPTRPTTIEARVAKILDETPLIDGHNDLAIFIRFAYKNQIHSSHFKDKFENGGMEAQVDLPRLRAGKVGGAFWSAFVPCPNDASNEFSDSVYAESVSSTLSQLDVIRRLHSTYGSNFSNPTSHSLSSSLAAWHSHRAMISPLSIEGLHQVPPSAPLSTLRLYHALGVRAATLTWNCHNAFADAALITSHGATTIAPYHRGGLTPSGREVIHEMNRLGMLIDLSHTSYWTQKSVLTNSTSRAPVIYSHSSSYALCPHPRNVHPDLLPLVKSTNSLIMINFTPDFISCLPPPNSSTLPELYEKNNTLHQVARHIIHIGSSIGFSHVGLGSDFDGMFATPRGLEGVHKFPDLVAELLRMGVLDDDVSAVVGGNILRVWRQVEAVAAQMQREGVVEGEDEVGDWRGV